MAIVLFLLGLFSARAMVEVPSQEPAAHCGGAGGGGDDGDDWGGKWRDQWLLNLKNQHKQKTVTIKNHGEPKKHIGDGLQLWDENDADGDWLEFEEEDFHHDNWDDMEVPEEAITFPSHLPLNSPAFRHILFEGAHCLL